jgi:hypothetical protein
LPAKRTEARVDRQQVLHRSRPPVPGGPDGVERAGVVSAAVVAVWAGTVLAVQAVMMGRHLDFFDESYQLILIARPEAARDAGEIFLFQFLIHPLLELTGNDIVAFRLLGMALLLGAVWWLSASSVALVTRAGPRWPPPARLIVYACALAAATTVYSVSGGILTYRSVAMIGLCLTIGGLAQVWLGRPFSGAVFGGLGLVVIATGKVTTAAATGAMVLVLLLLTRRHDPRVWLGGLFGSTSGVAVVLVAGGFSPATLVSFLRSGYGQLSAGGGYDADLDLLGVTPSPMRALVLLGPAVALPLVPALVAVVRRRTRDTRSPITDFALGLVVAAVCSVVAVAALSARGYGVLVLPLTEVMLVVAIVAAVVYPATGGLTPRHPTSGSVAATSEEWEPWFLVGTLVVAPYLLALGTNTLAAFNMGQASVFWALASLTGLALLTQQRREAARLLFPAAVVSLAVATTVQAVGITNGGRENSTLTANRGVTVLGGSLAVNEDDAGVLGQLAAVRDEHGLRGTPSIDLTGFASGYQLQLGTTPLGRASFFGVLEGAEDSAGYALDRESCEQKARAWLLYADDNPDDVSAALTVGTSLDLDRDYETVASFHPTQGPTSLRSVTVRVLRPGPDVADRLCRMDQ